MPKKVKVTSSIDRISSMPEEVLCHILSFLPTKYAVGTSILSTGWKNLFASLPDLDFDHSLLLHPFPEKEYGRSDSNDIQQLMIVHTEYHRYIENQMLTFMNCVYRVLLIRNISYIRKFSLKFKEAYDKAHINTWICSAIWRSVEQLCVQITWNSSITLPRELFRCDTLVVLKLGSYFALDVPSCVLFPRLKILDLDRIVIKGDDVTGRLFAGCPVIENVAIFSCELHDVHVLDISVTTLKSLTLHSLFGEDECDLEIMVNAPLLEYFKYIGFVVNGYSVTNLDSLVEAHIDVAIVEVTNAGLRYCGQLVANLVSAIFNVKVLYLSGETMEAFKHSDCWLPTFPNLTHLELGANDNVGWSLLPELLKSSYYLEKLAFVEGFTDQSDCCDKFTYCLLSCDKLPKRKNASIRELS